MKKSPGRKLSQFCILMIQNVIARNVEAAGSITFRFSTWNDLLNILTTGTNL